MVNECKNEKLLGDSLNQLTQKSQLFMWSIQPFENSSLWKSKSPTISSIRIVLNKNLSNNLDVNQADELTNRKVSKSKKSKSKSTYSLHSQKKPTKVNLRDVSLPLKWSHQFGTEGRRINSQKMKKKIKFLEKAVIPPLGQCDHIVQIIQKMVESLLNNLIAGFPKLLKLAESHRSKVLSPNSSFSGDSVISEIVKKVEKYNKSCEQNSLLFTKQSFKDTNKSSLSFRTTTPLVQSDSDTENDDVDENELKDCSDDDKIVTNFFSILSGTPNHRPLPESISLLLWIFSQLNSDVIINFTKETENLFQFSSYSNSVLRCTQILTAFVADRGLGGPTKYSLQHRDEAENTLRYWYDDKIQVFEKCIINKNDDPNKVTVPSSNNETATNSQTLSPHPPLQPPPSRSHTSGTYSRPKSVATNRTTTVDKSDSNQRKDVTLSNTESSMKSNLTECEEDQANSISPEKEGSSKMSKAKRSMSLFLKRISQPTSASSNKIFPPSIAPDDPRPKTSASRSRSKPLKLAKGFVPVTSGPILPLNFRAIDMNKPGTTYPKDSVSPGHVNIIAESSMYRAASRPLPPHHSSSSSSSLLTSNQNNQIFEKILVKVISHKGLSSYIKAMGWSNDREIGIITRCKHTENTASITKIAEDIGGLVDKSLRIFGASVLVDDILEQPPPPKSHLFVPVPLRNECVSHKNNKLAVNTSRSSSTKIAIDPKYKLDKENDIDEEEDEDDDDNQRDYSDLDDVLSTAGTAYSKSNLGSIPGVSSIGSISYRSSSSPLKESSIHSMSSIHRVVLSKASEKKRETKQADTEYLFYTLAPHLLSSQAVMMLSGVVSDCARTLILGVSVLVRHAWAGKKLSVGDIVKIFGDSCCKILGKDLLQDLHEWLLGNRRTDATFKQANQTHTDIALQNLFAFWPELLVGVDKDEDFTTTQLKEPKNLSCHVRLMWPHKHRVHKYFREPHTFIPNINAI